MKIYIETNHNRNESGLTIETKIKVGREMQPTVLMSIVVQDPSVNVAGDIHRTLLRRIKFAVEETL